MFFPYLFFGRDGLLPHFFYFFHLFPLFAFRACLSGRCSLTPCHTLQVGFLLSGSDDKRHILVPFRPVPFPFALPVVPVPHRHLCLSRFPPVRIIKVHYRNLLLQLPVGFSHECVLFGRHRGGFPAETVEHVTVAAEHPLADTLLHRKVLRLFGREMVGDSRDSHIRTDKPCERRPRTHAAHHKGICRSPQHLGRSFLQSARPVGGLASSLYLFGQRRTAQCLRQSQQARLRRLADNVVG